MMVFLKYRWITSIFVTLGLFFTISSQVEAKVHIYPSSIPTVRFPLLDELGDSNIEESEVLENADSPSMMTIGLEDKCKGFHSSRKFSPKKDINGHPGFPWVPAWPIEDDQLNATFFQEISTQTFWVERWPSGNFPVAVFHLTSKDRQYFSRVEKVINYINKRAVEENVVDPSNSLIKLSRKILSEKEIVCGSNIIRIIPNQKYFSGYTDSRVEYEKFDRLGEILNKDVYINISDYDVWEDEFMDPKQAMFAYNRQFYHEILHELLHALGLSHNFALGSVMDYEGQSYSDEVNPGSKKLYRIYDESLDYEMETLKFLYRDGYQKSEKNWPLVRSTQAGTFYYPNQIPVTWRFGKEYIGRLLSQDSTIICNGGDKKINTSSLLSKEFSLILTPKNEGAIDVLPFGEPLWVNLNIKGLFNSFPNLGLMAPLYVRNLPVIRGKIVDFSKNELIQPRIIKEAFLRLETGYTNALSNKSSNFLDVRFHLADQKMTCDFHIGFNIESSK